MRYYHRNCTSIGKPSLCTAIYYSEILLVFAVGFSLRFVPHRDPGERDRDCSFRRFILWRIDAAEQPLIEHLTDKV